VKQRNRQQSTSADWSEAEVRATVVDYLHMLKFELAGQRYNKAAHARELQRHLAGRSKSAIEYKRANISAALIDLGCPPLRGYQPYANYQRLLEDVLIDALARDSSFDQVAQAAAELPAVAIEHPDFAHVWQERPKPAQQRSSPAPAYALKRTGPQRDHLAREARNRSLGAAGEGFVLALEDHRLRAAGAKRLADRIEHVATTRGDSAGYDILSFEPDGRERFIEVKTTAHGRETPFFVSRNELAFSEHAGDQFHLYRVFEFRRKPKLFDLPGSVTLNCRLDPVSFLARIGA